MTGTKPEPDPALEIQKQPTSEPRSVPRHKPKPQPKPQPKLALGKRSKECAEAGLPAKEGTVSLVLILSKCSQAPLCTNLDPHYYLVAKFNLD